MRIAISGSTGLVGRALIPSLSQAGHEVVPLVRRGGRGLSWDPAAGTVDAAGLRSCDALVHLAAEPVDQRWTEAVRARILESRVQGTALLARTLREDPGQVRVVVMASGVGLAEGPVTTLLDEQADSGTGFLAQVVRAWEAAADFPVRTARLRLGVVLSTQGGALARMLPPFRLGLGGPLGRGHQGFPWIALPEVVQVIGRALEDPRFHGPLHTVSGVCPQKEFAQALGRAVHRPAWAPLPSFAVSALFGAMGRELLLTSIVPRPHPLVPQPALEEVLERVLRQAV